ncbi:MAG: FUSC family protein [Bacteroidota bacterium]
MSSIFRLPVLMYMLKCVCGFSLCYALYVCFPQHQFYWSMISVLLVISPEEDSSHRLAFDRMKANILGSIVGIAIFLTHVPTLFGMCLGVVMTISIGISMRLTNATRSALASLVIVLMHEQQESSWNIAVERMLCVVAGCFIAIIVTYMIGFVSRRLGHAESA